MVIIIIIRTVIIIAEILLLISNGAVTHRLRHHPVHFVLGKELDIANIPLGPSTNASSPPGCVFMIPLPSPPACEYTAAASFKSPSLQAKAQRQVEAKAPSAKTLSRVLSAHGPHSQVLRLLHNCCWAESSLKMCALHWSDECRLLLRTPGLFSVHRDIYLGRSPLNKKG